jgi:nitrogen regulatory protein PII
MMMNVIKTLEGQIQEIDKAISVMAAERDKIQQAVELLRGGADTQGTPKAKPVATGPKPPPRVREYKPGLFARPWTPAIYEFFENGNSHTIREVVHFLTTRGHAPGVDKIRYCMVNMKETGRLLYADGLWRRNPLSLKPGETAVEAVEKLKEETEQKPRVSTKGQNKIGSGFLAAKMNRQAIKKVAKKQAKKTGPQGGRSASARQRAEWKSQKFPWAPAAHAKPWTRLIYALMADGRAFTSEELLEELQKRGYPELTIGNVTGALQHMKNTNRVVRDGSAQGGFWRRKYVTPYRKESDQQSQKQSPEQSIEPAAPESSPRSSVVEKLEQLASEGKIPRIQTGSGTVYGLTKPLATGKSSS